MSYGQSLEALLSQPAASGIKSHVPGVVSEEEYPVTVAVSDEHGAEDECAYTAHGGAHAHPRPVELALSVDPLGLVCNLMMMGLLVA
ncbi:hypothetical protein Tco_0895220 [Tanacetum coccineum]|uniref:Uncharacterized protein n=1 Tax=Tanacetum coccineum TaxID=301880 RepID=A0ABQ5CF68_9ASTR